MRHYLPIILICIFALLSSYAHSYPRLITFKETKSSESALLNGTQQQNNNDNVIFAQEIMIDANIFAEIDSVEVQLDGENIVIVKNYSASYAEIGYQYNAYESDNASMFISKLGNNIQGIIHSASGTYNIDTYDNTYTLKKINMDDVPNEAEPILSENILPTHLLREESEDTAYVRVLVMYTPEALSLNSNMINKIYLDINNGNLSFNNSNVKAKFELAYAGQTIDSESGYSFNQLLEKYSTDGDGLFDEVHSLRDRYSADVCVLLVYNYTYCGLAYVWASANSSFAVVRASNECANKYSFTHEIGHNVGCMHDTITSPSNFYNHGYQHYIAGDNINSWRTMMAYDTLCITGCKRIPYWSNPNVNYNGVPTGNVTRCNNARVWNENAINVSYFRTDPISLSITHTDKSIYMDYAHWRASQTIVVDSGYVVNSGQVVKMSAANSITFKPNTKINAGAKFLATNIMDYPNSNYPQFLSAKHSSTQQESDLQQEKVDILISPNPSSSNINITLDLKDKKQCVSISILNISGQLQQNVVQSAFLQKGTIKYPVNVSSLSNGIFFVVVDIDGVVYVNKFIKQ